MTILPEAEGPFTGLKATLNARLLFWRPHFISRFRRRSLYNYNASASKPTRSPHPHRPPQRSALALQCHRRRGGTPSSRRTLRRGQNCRRKAARRRIIADVEQSGRAATRHPSVGSTQVRSIPRGWFDDVR